MPLAQQVKLVNHSDGIVVVTPDPDKPKSYLRFEAAGDPMLGDEQYITRDQLQQPDLIKAIRRGFLSVEGLSSDDPLTEVLRPRNAPVTPKADVPLTVQNVDFDPLNQYKMTTKIVNVPVDPLMRM